MNLSFVIKSSLDLTPRVRTPSFFSPLGCWRRFPPIIFSFGGPQSNFGFLNWPSAVKTLRTPGTTIVNGIQAWASWRTQALMMFAQPSLWWGEAELRGRRCGSTSGPHLMQSLRPEAPEVPHHVGVFHVGLRVTLLGVDKRRELQRKTERYIRELQFSTKT
jgi:hypothetical protein